jgi:hypothetical protein
VPFLQRSFAPTGIETLDRAGHHHERRRPLDHPSRRRRRLQADRRRGLPSARAVRHQGDQNERDRRQRDLEDRGREADRLLRDVAAELGLGWAAEILAGERERVRAILGGVSTAMWSAIRTRRETSTDLERYSASGDGAWDRHAQEPAP